MENDYGYLQFKAGPAGPFLTHRVPVRHQYADRWQALFEGRWRRIHVQIKRTYIVCDGQKITINVDGI